MNRLPPPFPRFLREGGVRYFGTELVLTLSLQTTGMEHRAHLARIVSCRHVGKTNTLREDSRRHHQSYRWAFYWQEASRMDCSGLAHRDLIAVAERNGDGYGHIRKDFPDHSSSSLEWEHLSSSFLFGICWLLDEFPNPTFWRSRAS